MQSCGFFQSIILRPLYFRLAAFVCLTSPLYSPAQAIIHVPSDAQSIQAGIDAAQNGDTVLVAPGTYQEAIDFKGKAITVTSGASSYADAAATVIEAPESVSAVTMHSGEPVTAVLNGFTITHQAHTGLVQDVENGVDLAGASGTITNNIIQNNAGCAVSAYRSPQLVVQGNHIQGQYQPTNLINQQFDCGYRNPTGSGAFGFATGFPAIFIYWCQQVSVLSNLIEDNSSLGVNGILDKSTETSLIQGNTIRNNATIGGHVGGMSIISPKAATIVQNLVYDNNKVNPDPPVTGAHPNIVDGESALEVSTSPQDEPVDYGQITLTVLNNTFYGNRYPGENGSGDYYFPTEFFLIGNANPEIGSTNSFASVTLENNLFISTQTTAPAVSCQNVNSGSVFHFNHNDVVEFPTWTDTCALHSSDGNNLSVDPQFISPATNNLHVQPSSSVVAVGDITASPLPSADLAGKNRFVCGTIDIGAYEVHPRPPIQLTVSANTITGGSSVTFTAQLTGNCNVPTGTIQFMDGANLLGTATLDSNATASFSTAGLTVGTHTITAFYPGDFNFYKSTSAPLTVVVTGAPTSTTLTISPNPASAFTPITLSSVVTSPAGQPSGTVAFTSGSQLLATAPVTTNGAATATISNLEAGNYSIVATYSATTMYATSSSAPVAETVIGAGSVTLLEAAPNPAVAGQNVAFTATAHAVQGTTIPTGTVTFSEGVTILGSSSLNPAGVATFSTASLPVGVHTVTASYGGSADFNPSTAYTVETITTIPTTTNLTASPNPAGQGQTITLTATVSASGGTAGGSVTFEDAGAPIGSAPLNGAGIATFTTSTLAIGTHNLAARYSGGGNLAASISPVLQETITASGFTLSVSPATLTVRVGQSGSVNVNLASYGSYSGTVSLAAGPLPAYVTATFAPTQTAISSSATATSRLTLSTTVVPIAKASPPSPTKERRIFEVTLAMLLCFPLAWKRRRRLPMLLVVSAAILTMLPLNGCGTVAFPIHAVTPGTYIIPITATDANNDQKQSSVTLIIAS